METKRTRQRISETKCWLFKKVNKVDKSLAKLTKRKGDNIQVNKTVGEKGNITTDTNEI
jgi:hypothetical protein